MNHLMTHVHGPKSTSYFVNDATHMTDYMINLETGFLNSEISLC